MRRGWVPYHALFADERIATLNRIGLALALIVTLSACAAHSDKHGVVSGSADLAAFYELPADAVFIAILEDVSQTDVAAQELGRARLEPAGQPPFHFEIDYDRSLIDPRHRYAVRARVESGNRTLLVSDTAYSVLTQGAGDKIHIVLKQT